MDLLVDEVGACGGVVGVRRKANDTFCIRKTMSQFRVEEFMVFYANKIRTVLNPSLIRENVPVW
jgi:hypothetical protein